MRLTKGGLVFILDAEQRTVPETSLVAALVNVVVVAFIFIDVSFILGCGSLRLRVAKGCVIYVSLVIGDEAFETLMTATAASGATSVRVLEHIVCLKRIFRFFCDDGNRDVSVLFGDGRVDRVFDTFLDLAGAVVEA